MNTTYLTPPFLEQVPSLRKYKDLTGAVEAHAINQSKSHDVVYLNEDTCCRVWAAA